MTAGPVCVLIFAQFHGVDTMWGAVIVSAIAAGALALWFTRSDQS